MTLYTLCTLGCSNRSNVHGSQQLRVFGTVCRLAPSRCLTRRCVGAVGQSSSRRVAEMSYAERNESPLPAPILSVSGPRRLVLPRQPFRRPLYTRRRRPPSQPFPSSPDAGRRSTAFHRQAAGHDASLYSASGASKSSRARGTVLNFLRGRKCGKDLIR